MKKLERVVHNLPAVINVIRGGYRRRDLRI